MILLPERKQIICHCHGGLPTSLVLLGSRSFHGTSNCHPKYESFIPKAVEMARSGIATGTFHIAGLLKSRFVRRDGTPGKKGWNQATPTTIPNPIRMRRHPSFIARSCSTPPPEKSHARRSTVQIIFGLLVVVRNQLE